jgi:hypothetical protein
MKTTSTCQQADCTEPTTGGYCAFHHLAFVSGPDIFTGLLESIGSLEGTALLGVIFDILDEPVPEPMCRHDARLGACYLGFAAGFPGLSRTPWELRAATYSLGIPLN